MRRILLLLFYLGGLLVSTSPAQKPLVVASIFPLAEIAREVGGEAIEVRLLLPPGADPHSWEPTPKDLLTLRRADLLLAVGGGLEPWLEDLLAGLKNRNLKIVLALDDGNLSPHKQGHDPEKDPHVWLDFPKDASLCLRLAETLGEICPAKVLYFRERGRLAAQRFKELDLLFARTLETCRYRTVPLAGHDAFHAWEENYGLDFITLAGRSPEAEPTPQALRKMIIFLRKTGLKAVYYDEPQALRFAKLIARETGAKIYYLNPGATLTREELRQEVSFFSLMRRNLRNLSLGLRCNLVKAGQN
ncbi:MAG: zinc ABC transporter substrate-binding protein [Thermodesulfobacteria bacterium]|nr:zinc ABC transporter substrate-binding protein [Thermodesulfobacteriota bacterium]